MQHVLEELPAGSALLFALGRYCPYASIPQSAGIAPSSPFLPDLFSRVFGADALKGKFRILNNAG
jgi:hypothetical protein